MVGSNVSSVVDELIEEALVTERAGVPAGRGRVPLLLKLNDAYPLFAVNLRSARMTVALAGLSGTLRDKYSQRSPQNPGDFVTAVNKIIRLLAERNGVRLKQARNIGVSVPGLVDSGSGEVLTLPFFPKYARFPLAGEIECLLGIPATIENDCNLAAMALLWQGEAEGYLSNFVLVDAGDVGLGAGIVMNRELYRGHDRRFAAEFGHMVVDPNGTLCRCGRRGCLELYSTDRATWRRLTGSDNLDNTKFEELIETAERGDEDAIRVFREAEEYLAIAIANIACTLNPNVILVSGRITRVPGSVRRIQASVNASMFKAEVRAAALPSDELFLRGAICLASERLFSRSPFT